MDTTFVGYIDESGDEGFAFGAGSSEWFVLSAVVTRKAHDLQTVRLVDKVRARLGRDPRKVLHFRDLRHEHRLVYVNAISTALLKTVSVLVHKPSLREREVFQERYRMYFYAVRYLLERVSWYCRDHKTGSDPGDGSIDLVFSNRSGMSYNELIAYLKQLQSRTGILDIRIEWNVVRPTQLIAAPAGRLLGLQVADAVAGSFWYAVEQSQYGFNEPRYAQMLKPVVYQRKGTYLGYGLKFFPRDIMDVLDEPRYDWITSVYK